MTAGIIVVLLLVLAATFWRRLGRVRTALGLGYLLSTGHVFLIFGYLLGLAFGEQSASLDRGIAPIITFVTGWVGFATGMRFELNVLRAVPRHAFSVALAPAVAAAVVVGPACYALLALTGIEQTRALGAATVLAAAAASSGPTLAAILRTRRPGRSPQMRSTLRMVELSAGLDDVVVILLAVLGFAFFRRVDEAVSSMSQAALAAGGGALLGVVTWLFLGGRAAEDERLLLGLAMLAFTAGFASWLMISPAAVTAISALVLANLPGARITQLFQAVRRVERPAVVILMTVIGFRIAGPLGWQVAPLIVIMTLLRMGVKYTSGQMVVGPIVGAPGLVAGPGWAHGLVPQGTLGLMITLGFYQLWHDDIARWVLAAVAISGLLNELVAPILFARTLQAQHARAVTESGRRRDPGQPVEPSREDAA